MRVAVLGAGVVGTTTAWYLRQQGFDVDVYDRQLQPAMETSFANGAQISVCHAEPWAGPGVPTKALKWMTDPQAPLLFRLKMDPAQWLWGLQFLRECTQQRWEKNVQNLIALGLYSRSQLQQLRHELQLDYDQETKGIVHIYNDKNMFEAAQHSAAFMQRFGIDKQTYRPNELYKIDPALAHLESHVVGATYTKTDETGDALIFTQQLMEHAKRAGVRFHPNIWIDGWKYQHNDKIYPIEGVRAHNQYDESFVIQADQYVIAMGPHSAALAKPLGVYVPIYPAKGYSATYDIIEDGNIPHVSVTDEARKVVFSRLGRRLRVAGTAEFNGWNKELNWERCNALDNAVRAWFANSVDHQAVQYWTGLRPATPNNTPWIGKLHDQHPVWINAGHGTLGWTHACGSSKGLALLMSGDKPDCAFSWKKPRP